MLQLRNITKDYKVGDSTVPALKGVSLAFRRNEFVSILGASGCGKTTLLNIIGGLDKYTSGDLIIEGISTKDYHDGDWDTYRNHRIGFVFQTYNLIPHQTVLANVELALTLSGVSPKERKERATEALQRVGLGKELNKRPNQLSGGQMQRVAIARALVNNPEILLADEPTGALDTNTSVQIMDLIKEIAGERLVIMVTHNPELAYKYSSRIVELKDGLVVSDSAPYSMEEEEAEVAEYKRREEEEKLAEAERERNDKSAARAAVYKRKHSAMSYLTAFALSGKSLLTRKARTIVTSIAGSIGIISVCLVLALSAGFNSYINQTEEDMLSYYPVTVNETSLDLTSAMSSFMSGSTNNLELDEIEDKVYVNSFLSQLAQGMTTYNDFTESNVATINGEDMTYLEYLEAMPEELYNAIYYSYGLSIAANLFTDVEIGSTSTSEGTTTPMHMSLESLREYYTYLLTERAEQFSNLTQFVQYFTDVVSVMPNSDLSSENYGEYVLSQYDVVAGHFPEKSNEIVLVVGDQNDVVDLTLVQLGFMSEQEFLNLFINSQDGEDNIVGIDFDDVLDKEYTLYYNDAVFTDSYTATITLPDGSTITQTVPASDLGYSYIYQGYAQASDDDEPVSEEDGITLKISGILRLKDGLTYGCLEEGLCLTESLVDEYIQKNMQSDIVQTLNSVSDSDSSAATINNLVGELTFENVFEGSYTLTPRYSSTSTTLSELIRELGGNDQPSGISIYAKDFNTKQDMLDYLDEWNSAVEAARTAYYAEHGTYEGYDGPTEVSYTDTVGTLMGLVNTILNAITYVLIAFTAISLVVSTVMIGVITYVSVVERTKEIGILRSIGARKRDIRHVFNAETFIIGLFAGLIGIIVAYLLQLLINVILTPLTGISGLAALPIWQAIIMVCVSVVLTLISGLIPASAAAKKDPVIALRTE